MTISEYKGRHKITTSLGIPPEDIDTMTVILYEHLSEKTTEKSEKNTDSMLLDFPIGIYSITIKVASKEDVYTEEDTAVSIPPVDENILINGILLKAIGTGKLSLEELVYCFELFDYSTLKN